MNLKDKIAFITGGSEGLGKATAENLSREGAKVALVARNLENLRRVAKKIGRNAYPLACDVTKPGEVKKVVNQVIKKFGRIDIIINCAGAWHKKNSLEKISDDEIQTIIDVNLKGVINVTKYTLPILKENKESYIVNISSHSGVKAKLHQSVYCGAKFGVRGFTEALKLELKETNIKVVGFYPSGMNTQMFQKAGETFSSKDFMKTTDIAEIIKFVITRSGNIHLEELWVDKFSS